MGSRVVQPLEALASMGVQIRLCHGVLQAGPSAALTVEARALIAAYRPALIEMLHGLSPKLERGIRSMAGRWGYTPDELADALARAAVDPVAWASCVALDEEREAKTGASKGKLRTDA